MTQSVREMRVVLNARLENASHAYEELTRDAIANGGRDMPTLRKVAKTFGLDLQQLKTWRHNTLNARRKALARASE